MASDHTTPPADLPEALRLAAEAVKAWANIDDFWSLPDSDCGEMVLGAIEDGTKYDLLQIDADNYGTDGESEKLARFYAAANPGAVLALLDERDRLATQVAAPIAAAPAVASPTSEQAGAPDWGSRGTQTLAGWINELGTLSEHPQVGASWLRSAMRTIFCGLQAHAAPESGGDARAAKGDKQRARDAYAAGMGDPLVIPASPTTEQAGATGEPDLVWLAEDPEEGGSADEIAERISDDMGIGDEAEVEVNCARYMPNRKIRVRLERDEESGDPITSWKWVIPAPASGGDALDADLWPAARDVLSERRRQVSSEGRTAKHDDEHSDGSMALAAACYAMYAPLPAGERIDGAASQLHSANGKNFPGGLAWLSIWPWARQWWKPKSPRQDAVRACALLLAEIERMDRAAMAAKGQEGGTA